MSNNIFTLKSNFVNLHCPTPISRPIPLYRTSGNLRGSRSRFSINTSDHYHRTHRPRSLSRLKIHLYKSESDVACKRFHCSRLCVYTKDMFEQQKIKEKIAFAIAFALIERNLYAPVLASVNTPLAALMAL